MNELTGQQIANVEAWQHSILVPHLYCPACETPLGAWKNGTYCSNGCGAGLMGAADIRDRKSVV